MKQRIVKIGNSAGVTIPKSVLKEQGVKVGSVVNTTYMADMGSYNIGFPQKTKAKTPASSEFRRWLDQFIEEDREILDELASR